MDSLKDLPTDEKASLSPEQKHIIQKYVGGGAPDNSDSSGEPTSKWKIVGYIVAVFLALINPISQGLLSKVPYFSGNYVTMLALTTLIFAVCVAIVIYYA